MPPRGDLKSVGEYDVLAKLGEGGAGVVYKARHRETEEVVAIKVLLPQQAADAVVLKRFEQEFRATSPLNHPNLIRGLDYIEADGTAFLIMEYVEGRSMGERLEFLGQYTAAEAVDLIAQIGSALDWLHDQGILHRDVKPDNIIVTADGVAKLTDLGLAKELLYDQSLTRTGSALGTPNFMAPEQFRDAKRVDRTSDIYSLAATFYQMVTGEIPFQSSSPFDAWQKKTKNDLAPARELVPDLPVHIDRAVRRAMSGNPRERPTSCAEFVRALSRPPESDSEPRVDLQWDRVPAFDSPSDADAWELVFEGGDAENPVRVDTAGIRQFLKNSNVKSGVGILARRRPIDPFNPLTRFPEFSDILSAMAGRTPGGPRSASPAGSKSGQTPSPAARTRLRLELVLLAAAIIFLIGVICLKL
ncbi:serine/threonine-protein kinase [Fimbriiglobus ruber]|uniref:Serine/threonine protein kinase PrkC, regulator of stationary phase n=1 Tax=Fimbriiglobus ruber TaxID=1908690 RepID=A0A225E3F5_9BACT|nr:serine/threonine-protein kinase [Fimbriiglobus ruber]OWK45328.1 Serine/threonine protein kinase PrkC, regulator of stationary phase [Fimbriiglobus ruber]